VKATLFLCVYYIPVHCNILSSFGFQQYNARKGYQDIYIYS